MATYTNSILGDLLPDATALTIIAAILSEEEWDAETLDEIAMLVRHTGRTIAEPDTTED